MRLSQPALVARIEEVVPGGARLTADVVPSRPAAHRRAVPFTIVVDDVPRVLDGLTRRLEISGDLHRARLKVLATAPVLAVDGGGRPHPHNSPGGVPGQGQPIEAGRPIGNLEEPLPVKPPRAP